MLEAILFVSGEPVKMSRIAAVLGVEEFDIDAAANRLRDKYSFERRGIRLVKLEGALQLCSSPEFADYIRLVLETRKPPQLSPPALEVLAIIAYFEPVTKAYVEQVRGVDSSYTVGLLVERGLIEACGRLNAPGRPVLYKTTHVFLRTFGLESLHELPGLPKIESPEDGREGISAAIAELKAKEEKVASEFAETTENIVAQSVETAEKELAENITENAEVEVAADTAVEDKETMESDKIDDVKKAIETGEAKEV